MRRAIAAAVVTVASVVFFAASPAEGSTTYAGTMTGTSPSTFKFTKGVCSTFSGDGNFTLQVGDSVMWTNCTDAAHTVTGDSFGDGTSIAKGESITHTFNTAGTYPYHCNFHPSMTGTVTVGGQSTTTQQTTPATTATTQRATTTTSSTVPPSTTTTGDINGVFTTEPTTSTTSTTLFSTATTRALGEGGEGSNAGVVAALIVGLGAVGTIGALIIRRMRAGDVPPPSDPPTQFL